MRCRIFIFLFSACAAGAQWRPPAVPLVTHDPYFSIWSMSNTLNGDATKHWTGKPNTLTAYARIDGKVYRIMGRDRGAQPELRQTRLQVLPMRTIYVFAPFSRIPHRLGVPPARFRWRAGFDDRSRNEDASNRYSL